MTFPIQKSLGDFTHERFGPNWVYGRSKKQESFGRNGERQTVITKKEQRRLHADYKREWGAEHDLPAWRALCALRETAGDEGWDSLQWKTQQMIREAVEALTT